MISKLLILTSCACLAAFAETEREKQLENRIRILEERLAALEARFGPHTPQLPASVPASGGAPKQARAPSEELALPAGLNVNAWFDGNYTWKAARPYNRINLRRAYDVLHNNFNINQTGLIIEGPVNLEEGRRFGIRVDLMFGQAAETVQGGGQSEPRPQFGAKQGVW